MWPWKRAAPADGSETSGAAGGSEASGAADGGRSREAGAGWDSSLPEVARAPVGDWRHLPPLQRVVAEHPVTNPTARFSAGLAAWQDPTFLAPLRHTVGPGEPSGTVEAAPVRPVDPEPVEESLPIVEPGPVSRLVDRVVQRFGGGAGDVSGGRSRAGRTPGSGAVTTTGGRSDLVLTLVPLAEPPTSGLRPTADSGRASGTRAGEGSVQRSVGGSHVGAPIGGTSPARRTDGDFAATGQGVAPHAHPDRDDASHAGHAEHAGHANHAEHTSHAGNAEHAGHAAHWGHPHDEPHHATATDGAASSVQRDLTDAPLLGAAASPASTRDGADLAADPDGTPGAGVLDTGDLGVADLGTADLGTGHTGTAHPDPTSSHGHGPTIQRELSLAPGHGPTTGPAGGPTDGLADEATPGAPDASGLGVGTTFDLYPGSTATSGEMASGSTGLISGDLGISGDLSSGTFPTGPAPGTDRTGSAGPFLQRSTSADPSSGGQTSSERGAARMGDGPRHRRLGLGAPLAPGELPTALHRQTNPDQPGTGHDDRAVQRTADLPGDPAGGLTGPPGSIGDSALTSDTSPFSGPPQGTSGLLDGLWDAAQSNSPWDTAQSGGAGGSADLSATTGFDDLSDAGASAVPSGETGDSTGLLGTHRLGDSGDSFGLLGETPGSANPLGGSGTAGLPVGTQGSRSGGSVPGGGPSGAPTVGGVVQRLADSNGPGGPGGPASQRAPGDLSAQNAPATSPTWSDTTGDLPLGSGSASAGDARSGAVRVLALPAPSPGPSTGLLGHQSLPMALQRIQDPSGPGATAPLHPGATSPPHPGTPYPSHTDTASASHLGTASASHFGASSAPHAGTTSPFHAGTRNPTRSEVTAQTYPATAPLPGTRAPSAPWTTGATSTPWAAARPVPTLPLPTATTQPDPPDPDPPAPVQRLPEPDPPPITPSLVRTEEAFVQRAEAAPAQAPATGDGAPQEELLKKLFDPLLRRLKAELRLDRDRRGSLTDLRH
ncbi:hypothetical protein [Longispora urticae]